MEQKEYNELLLKCYEENNANIEKWIFLGSTGALSILVSYSDKIKEDCFTIFVISIICFLTTIIIQLISAYISKRGCDLGLDQEGNFNEESCKCFNISENLNKCFMVTFVIALIMTTITIVNNNYYYKLSKNNSRNNNCIILEQQIKVKDFDHYIKNGGINE